VRLGKHADSAPGDTPPNAPLSDFSVGGIVECVSVAGGSFALHEHTELPPEETKQLLKLLAMTRDEPSGGVALVGPDGSQRELPAEIYRVLQDALEAMSQGLAVTVVPQHTMLTTQEAADLLGISRPTLVKLLERGQIPYERRGRHRRLRLDDVLEYQRAARTERRQKLDALVDAAEKHDLYSATATPRRTR
jgi:excisionase family DNA binding protein